MFFVQSLIFTHNFSCFFLLSLYLLFYFSQRKVMVLIEVVTYLNTVISVPVFPCESKPVNLR